MTPDCLQLPLNKLEYVSFYGFASPNCVQAFAMLFIFQAPSLLRIFIEQPIGTKSSKDLSDLPRASSKVELVIR